MFQYTGSWAWKSNTLMRGMRVFQSVKEGSLQARERLTCAKGATR